MGNEMGNNNTSSLKEVKEEGVRVDALDGSIHEAIKENDVKGDHLIAEDEGKDFHEKAEGLAFHSAIAGDSHANQSTSGDKSPQVPISQATQEVNEGDRNVEDQPELLLVNPEDMEPSVKSDVVDRDKINIEAANIEAENGETNSSLTLLGDLGTQTHEGIKTDPLGLDKIIVSTSASNACGSEVSREDFLGSPSTFLADGNNSALETETPSSSNVTALFDANIDCRHLKLEQEQVEVDKASNVELLTMNKENRLEDRMASNFLNFGREEKLNEATTVSGSTLQSEDSLEDQSGLVMEEIESASSGLINENNIKWDKGLVRHSGEPCNVQHEMAEPKDVSKMVVGLESITDDVGKTVEVFLDGPSDKECKVKATDVTEYGFQDDTVAEASNFLNLGHEGKLNEETTVSDSTLQSENSVVHHPQYSHPEVLELKEQSGLVMEEIEFTSSRLVNENNIKCDNGPVGQDEPCNVQPGMAEATDVSEMVVGLESITDDVANTVEMPLDCPNKECKVKVTNVKESGFQEEICGEAAKDFLEYIEGEDSALPISIEPEAGDNNHDKKQSTEKELIEDKHVETELSQANADDTSRKVVTEQSIPIHSPYFCDSFSSVDYQVMINPVSETNASGDRRNCESQQCQMPMTEVENFSGSLSAEFKSYNDTHIHPQLQKFPSFDFDLLMGSRSEESDQTPLLFPARSTFRSMSVKGRCDRAKQVDCVEEKTVMIDRSDFEKPKTPFLGSSKTGQEDDEKQEAYVVSTSQKQGVKEADNKASKAMWVVPTEEVGSTSPKGKEKRKFRASLFGNCMCCASVIN